MGTQNRKKIPIGKGNGSPIGVPPSIDNVIEKKREKCFVYGVQEATSAPWGIGTTPEIPGKPALVLTRKSVHLFAPARLMRVFCVGTPSISPKLAGHLCWSLALPQPDHGTEDAGS